ncbi:hypothetical protein GGR57DRAFT_512940 [Xylariaceae sp. FL1272]|nr:hypothetical protein GGR57DRAFT_512940 [Xylariaceae sp. FL1272]
MAYSVEETTDDGFDEGVHRSSPELHLLSTSDEENHRETAQKSRHNKSRFIPFLFHTGVLLTYSILFLFASWHMESRLRRANVIESSATSSIMYGTRVFDEIDNLNLYFGEPSAALDARWEELLQYQWIQVPKSDMRRLGREEEGIQLPGGGYFGTLAIFHDLHCLRRVHHAFYRDHYFPNLTKKEKWLDQMHAAFAKAFNAKEMCRY